MEPIHVHISKGKPTANVTKIWITKGGSCIVGHNKGKIPEKDLKYLMGVITSNYFLILEQWKKHSVNKDIKFYC